jgi:alpha-L-arabinofuranosidase
LTARRAAIIETATRARGLVCSSPRGADQIYDGIWAGEHSPIPNTRGFRNDVIAALRELSVPVVRWSGGCFLHLD